LTFGGTLSPGFVSYQVSTFVAPFHPASERSPSITMGPVARVMWIVWGSSAVSRERRSASRYRRTRKTTRVLRAMTVVKT
jgi:threonine/homoserine/homoserine lactone efflux protein